jgi:hypothetical protein
MSQGDELKLTRNESRETRADRVVIISPDGMTVL